MPALDDDREEALAQELAKGATQALAWTNAGYSAKNSNVASVECNKRLKKNPAIRERVEELRAIMRDTEITADFKLDVESLTKLLLEDRLFARQCGQSGAAVSASSALMKLGKLGGENPVGSKDNPLVTVTKIELVPGEKPPA